MKFINSILTLAIIVFLSSCSDNIPGGNNTNDGNLEGTWNLVFLESESIVNIDDTEFDIQLVQEIKIEGSNFDFTTTYNEDNSLVSGGRYDLSITTTIDGETAKISESIDEENNLAEYTLDGTTLTVYDPSGEVATSTIAKLTSDELILKVDMIKRDTIVNVITVSDTQSEYRFIR